MDNGRSPYIVNKGAETPLAWAGASFMLCCYYESWAISLSVVSGAVIWSEEPEMRGGSIRSPEAATSHGPGSGHQQQRKYAAAEPRHDPAHSAAHRCCPAGYLSFTHIDKYLDIYIDIYCAS